MANEPIPWHRLFGLCWVGFFQGTDVEVLTEIDLSVKKQFLDLVIIHKGAEPVPLRLPDGFDLVKYNLVTFKSFQEPLDEFALAELIGHFVNYRKQSSPSLNELLAESDYRLFAVCARYPRDLIEAAGFVKLQEGIYDAWVLGKYRIRVIVLAEFPLEENNAMLLMFSAREKALIYARQHYRPHSTDISSLLLRLFQAYSEEPEMPDKLKEFARQAIDEFLQALPPEERLKGLPVEELRKRMSPEERLEGLSAAELIAGLTPETLEALARQLKSNGSSKQQ